MTTLEESIKKMLVYYDPRELIRSGAPADEYDSCMTKVVTLVTSYNIDIGNIVNKFSGYISTTAPYRVTQYKSYNHGPY